MSRNRRIRRLECLIDKYAKLPLRRKRHDAIEVISSRMVPLDKPPTLSPVIMTRQTPTKFAEVVRI
jgi:hypothetical protein